MPTYYVVANVAYTITAASEEAALDAIGAGTAPDPSPITALVYRSERSYLEADKVNYAHRRRYDSRSAAPVDDRRR